MQCFLCIVSVLVLNCCTCIRHILNRILRFNAWKLNFGQLPHLVGLRMTLPFDLNPVRPSTVNSFHYFRLADQSHCLVRRHIFVWIHSDSLIFVTIIKLNLFLLRISLKTLYEHVYLRICIYLVNIYGINSFPQFWKLSDTISTTFWCEWLVNSENM